MRRKVLDADVSLYFHNSADPGIRTISTHEKGTNQRAGRAFAVAGKQMSRKGRPGHGVIGRPADTLRPELHQLGREQRRQQMHQRRRDPIVEEARDVRLPDNCVLDVTQYRDVPRPGDGQRIRAQDDHDHRQNQQSLEDTEHPTDDVVHDRMAGIELHPVVETGDCYLQDYRGEEEDQDERKKPVVTRVELRPVAGEKVPYVVARDSRDNEGEEHRQNAKKAMDRPLHDAEDEAHEKQDDDRQIGEWRTSDRCDYVHGDTSARPTVQRLECRE